MAIKPSSDIVLEVLKAADPVRAQATTQRLAALGGTGIDQADDFAKVLDATEPSPVGAADTAGQLRDRLPRLSLDGVDDPKAARVEVEFEASVLKTFVDAILPKDESDIYGQGSAGDIWKSMLADQVARQIAKSGAFGLSKRLFATHPLPGHNPLTASSLASSSPLGALASRAAAELADPAQSTLGDAALLSLTNSRL